MAIVYSLIMFSGFAIFFYAFIYDLFVLYERDLKSYFNKHGMTIIAMNKPNPGTIKVNFPDHYWSTGYKPFFPNHFRKVKVKDAQGLTRLYIVRMRSWYFKRPTIIARELVNQSD